jgi:DNA-binding transcriptional MerR regulator
MVKVNPQKLYYTISEVSKITGVKQYVLRYWETEFSNLRPLKSSSGQRKYKQKDVDRIQLIKQLLYDESYTIAGAKKKLNAAEMPDDKKRDLFELLQYTKKELKALLSKLNR